MEYKKNENYSFRTISSDKIREELINGHLLKYPDDSK